ncbi:MAG: chitobiase/beta-hexosaminidase C-terminal domain-containing protein [Myxococcales bacterium]|nr:chitobiase/beta-hexosaminidase C-terminal domain-containing protein [Myxococcales bacterium]
MSKRLLHLIFPLAACLVAACDDGGGDPPTNDPRDAAPMVDGDNPPDPICEPDRRRCTDDGVEVCVAGTAWLTVGPCPAGTECRDGECVEPDCEPACQGRICGSDGCGGTCGECEAGEICSLEGRCDPPPPSCGDDACNGAEDCSTCPADCGNCCGDGTCDAAAGERCTTCPADCGCPAGEVCDADSAACEACAPQCDGRVCGDDGCGGLCGQCDDGVACVAGRCDAPCVPACAGRACGGDGCGGLCGMCEGEDVCTADGRCVAAPAQCGDDTCDPDEDCSTCPADCGACCGDGACVAGVGEDCSTCPADCGCPGGQACNVPARRCEAVCVPQCAGRNCGDDGCGGVCGNCLGGQRCEAGVCRDVCQPACAGRECGGDGCGGTCGMCPQGEACDDGTCEAICTPDCAGRVCGPDGCGGFCGNCGIGAFCTAAGRCEAVCVPDCDGRECGDNGCGGDCGGCGPAEQCSGAGICEPRCQPVCAGRECGGDGCGGVCGMCEAGEACGPGGVCVGGAGCDCPVGDLCLDGVCRAPDALCGPQNPNGLCPAGRACLAGACVDRGAGCSLNNPTGACGAGEVCRNGACAALDGSVLCDDDNACTADLYDPVRNACVNVAADAPCSDGNGCTRDACVNGACVGELIAGCVAPPVVEPVPSPTNDGDLTLRGTKPAGASVQINGDEAAPESPEQNWSVDVQLQPGENTFEISTRDRGVQSETVTITVVYDITPPVITVTPAGGIYLDGITVTVSTDEPAIVYYTDDGGTPDLWKKQFRSIKRLRVFNDTRFAFRARDIAGNWSETVAASFEITGEGTGWRELPALPEALIHGASAVRSDGIWLVGGSDGEEPQAGAWRMSDLAAGWVAAPALPTARSQAALAVANDVLYLFGGQDDGVPLNEVQQLPVGAGAWVRRSPMPTTRFGLAAATVGDFVYVFGGKTNGGVVLTTAERYNWRTNTWDNAVPQMPRPRYGHVAVTVDGRIHVMGGEDEDGRPVAGMDVFDPATGAWTPGPALPTPRAFAAAGVIRNVGDVPGGSTELVVAGGRLGDGSSTPIVESFVVEDGVWRARRPLARPAHAAGGAVWSLPPESGVDRTEELLVMTGGLVGGAGAMGGAPTAAVLAFSHARDWLRGLAPLPEGRFAHAAVEHNGLFYVLGGRNFQATTLFWAYDPETGRTVDLPALPSVHNGLASVVLDGLVYAIGGANQFNNAIPTLRRYDPATRRWTDLRPMITARRDAAAVVLGGEIWVLGGDNNGPQQAVEIYDPRTDRWRAGPVLPQGRAAARAVVWRGEIVMIGGVTPAGTFDPTLRVLRGGAWVDSWQVPGMAWHHVALVGDAQLGLFGGREGAAPTDRVVSLDLTTGFVTRAISAAGNLLPPLDRAALVPHHGRLYLLGGNITAEVGPEGLADVQAIIARCFNGRLDGREVPAGGAAFDTGGGCPIAVPLADFDVRLAGGDRLGVLDRIEVYHRGSWWPVCDDGWDSTDATVACRQIFGPSVRGIATSQGVGQNPQFILDDVACRGDEARLIDCGNIGLYSHNCGLGETALVTCVAN